MLDFPFCKVYTRSSDLRTEGRPSVLFFSVMFTHRGSYADIHDTFLMLSGITAESFWETETVFPEIILACPSEINR